MKIKKTIEVPNPGSDEAIKRGCICAVLDNRHGLGAFFSGAGMFWITQGCPLHDPDAVEKCKYCGDPVYKYQANVHEGCARMEGVKDMIAWGHEHCEHDKGNLQALRAYCPICWQSKREEVTNEANK